MDRHPKAPKQPALFWLLLAFNIVMWVLVIPLRVIQ